MFLGISLLFSNIKLLQISRVFCLKIMPEFVISEGHEGCKISGAGDACSSEIAHSIVVIS